MSTLSTFVPPNGELLCDITLAAARASASVVTFLLCNLSTVEKQLPNELLFKVFEEAELLNLVSEDHARRYYLDLFSTEKECVKRMSRSQYFGGLDLRAIDIYGIDQFHIREESYNENTTRAMLQLPAGLKSYCRAHKAGWYEFAPYRRVFSHLRNKVSDKDKHELSTKHLLSLYWRKDGFNLFEYAVDNRIVDVDNIGFDDDDYLITIIRLLLGDGKLSTLKKLIIDDFNRRAITAYARGMRDIQDSKKIEDFFALITDKEVADDMKLSLFQWSVNRPHCIEICNKLGFCPSSFDLYMAINCYITWEEEDTSENHVVWVEELLRVYGDRVSYGKVPFRKGDQCTAKFYTEIDDRSNNYCNPSRGRYYIPWVEIFVEKGGKLNALNTNFTESCKELNPRLYQAIVNSGHTINVPRKRTTKPKK